MPNKHLTSELTQVVESNYKGIGMLTGAERPAQSAGEFSSQIKMSLGTRPCLMYMY